MKEIIVLYPSPSISHLVSTIELAKLILNHNPSFSITIIIPSSINSGEDAKTAAYVTGVSTQLSATFHHLPALDPPPPPPQPHTIKFLHFLGQSMDDIPRLNNPNLLKTLRTLAETSTIKAIVLDFFHSAASTVAEDLNIPTYYLYHSCANALAFLIHFSTLDQKDVTPTKDLPGIPRLSPGDFPLVLHHPTTKAYMGVMNAGTQMPKSKGIIVNTFEALEARALTAIRDGLCVPNAATPLVFCVGPYGSRGKVGDDDRCLSWLSLQPSRSVVFLNFGSMGSFSADQLKEIAIGLENSGHRFLWVVLNSNLDLNAWLPHGFVERTKDVGILVTSWAPQAAILSHDSVGGFVTHCGWNSILEAICGGVPVLGWPLYAEQNFNRVILVEELKVGLSVKKGENGFVSAAELAERVRELMESEKGKELRDRILAMRNYAEAATSDAGSSRVALSRLVESWK